MFEGASLLKKLAQWKSTAKDFPVLFPVISQTGLHANDATLGIRRVKLSMLDPVEQEQQRDHKSG